MKTALGTWQLFPSDGFWSDQDPLAAEKFLRFAISKGITTFDTAASYGNGRAEQVLGKVLRTTPNSSFSVSTKIMCSVTDPRRVFSQSLSRLGLKEVDTLYLHWPKSGFNWVNYVKKMQVLKKEGLVKNIGVCNLSFRNLKMLTEETTIDCFQRPCSLLWTQDWSESLTLCKELGISVTGYSPLGMGLLSGKYRSSSSLTDKRSALFCFQNQCLPAFLDLLDSLEFVSKQEGLSYTDVAISYACSMQPDLLLLGSRNTEQLEQNLRSASVVLSSDSLFLLGQKAYALSLCVDRKTDNIFSYLW